MFGFCEYILSIAIEVSGDDVTGDGQSREAWQRLRCRHGR